MTVTYVRQDGGWVGGNDVLNLPLVAWEGGSDYWAQFDRAAASGWSDPGFFPKATFLKPASEAAAYADVGVNTFYPINLDSSGDVAGAIAALEANDMYALIGQQAFPGAPPSVDSDRFVGWWIEDECEMGLGRCAPGAGGVTCADRLGLYTNWVNEVRGHNDGRFIGNNFGAGVRGVFFCTDEFGQMARLGDQICVDQYAYTSDTILETLTGQGDNPLPPFWPGPEGDMDYAQKAATYGWIAETIRNEFDAVPLRSVWVFIETMRPVIGNDPQTEPITPAQMRGAVWHAIIKEARGIAYFDHNDAQAPHDTSSSPLHMASNGLPDVATELHAKIDTLAPVINTQSRVWNYGSTGVVTMTKIYGGYLYIFAGIGLGGTTGSKTLTLPSNISGTTVEVIDGTGGPLAVNNDEFSYTFANEYSTLVGRIAI